MQFLQRNIETAGLFANAGAKAGLQSRSMWTVLVMLRPEYPEALLQLLKEYHYIPKVVMDCGEVRGNFTDIIVDNVFAGGYMSTHYLLDHDHRDILVLFPASWRVTRAGGDHSRGYLHALKETGILPNQARIVQGDF